MDRRMFALAANTAREMVRQPIFYFIVCGGTFLIAASFAFTLFAFGEELKLIKEMGISTITICCLCLASLSAANTVSKEVEKGTIMNLLSKSVSRRSIILGKFFGLMAVVLFTFTILGALLTILLFVMGSLEHHGSITAFSAEMVYPTLFQLLFSFLQLAIMCSIAIAGSIYLPMVSNLSFCMFIYIMGNLVNFFQDLFLGCEDGFLWYISFFYVFFPNLASFSGISMGGRLENFKTSYLVLLVLYAILYTTLAMIVTFEIFNRKECC